MNIQAKRELDNLIEKINHTVNAEEIYLFGSFADGREKQDSDFDIYVVLDPSEIRPIKAIQKINFALSQLDIRAVDILANYNHTFLTASRSPSLERSILEKGVKVYERTVSFSQTMA